MSCAKGTRNRKGIIRELSRVSNRSEKEIQSLTEQERGAIFVKRLAKFSASFVGSVIGAAIGAAYMAAAEQLMNRINTDAGNVLQRFQEARASVPDSLWVFLLSMVAQESTPQQQAAIEAIRYTIGESRLTTVLPFGVGDEPEMSKLEKYLLALHAKSPAEALPLISGLSEINPARPENWLLYGLAGLESQPPKTVQERAWWLTARLYLVGSDFTKSDKPMADAALGEPDVVKAIFTQQQLAGARKMIGEYLIRQLAMSKNFPLLLEVLPPEMVRSCSALTPIIVNEADEQASKGNIDQVRALVARFPEIKEHGVMATAFRRAGQFELAAKELENAKVELLGEKELIEARIANAFELVIPEDHDAQDQLFERLSDIEEAGRPKPGSRILPRPVPHFGRRPRNGRTSILRPLRA